MTYHQLIKFTSKILGKFYHACFLLEDIGKQIFPKLSILQLALLSVCKFEDYIDCLKQEIILHFFVKTFIQSFKCDLIVYSAILQIGVK